MFRGTSKLSIYTTIIALCVTLFFVVPDMAYAQDTELTEEIGSYVNMGIKLLSWIWIVPASIAGKLMTNDFTYGGAFYLETYLRKIRIIMRTFAFFTLGFIFIVLIAKHFIKNDAPSKLGDLLMKVLLAGVLIPSTRFIIAAIIDISVIATAAVASFPQLIIQDQRNSLKTTISIQEKHDVHSLDIEQLTQNPEAEREVELEDILPSADNVAGPLIFMGGAILKLIDTSHISDDQGGSSASTRKQLTIASIIKIIALLLFIVPLIVLMVVNMIRIFWIRIWIIFSPFIVLDQIFKGPLQAHDKMGKNFKISNILGLIFQPVAIVGLISLGLILLIGIRDVLVGGGQYTEGAIEDKLHIHSDETTSTFGYNTDIAEVVVSGGFFEDLGSRVGGFVGEMILLLFTVFLLRALVKAGFQMSEITKGVANSIYKFSEGMIKTIPLPGTSLSWASAGKGINKLTQDKMGMEKKVRAQSYELNKNIDRVFGIDTSNEINNTQREKILSAMASGNSFIEKGKNFWNEIIEYSRNNQVMYNARFREILNDWFERGDAKTYLVRAKVITEEEAKKTPAEIMNMPPFLTFIDHILSNKALPDVRARRESVKSLESKVRGKSD